MTDEIRISDFGTAEMIETSCFEHSFFEGSILFRASNFDIRAFSV